MRIATSLALMGFATLKGKHMADDDVGVRDQEAAAPEYDAAEPKPGSKEYNFRRLEEKASHLERELERERQEKQWMMQQGARAPQQQVQQQEEIDWNSFESDDYAESKKVGKALKTLYKQLTEKEQKINFLETALNHKDFNEVVTEENVKTYIMNDPDMVRAVQTSSNPGQTMYKLIAKNADFRESQVRKAKPPSQEHKKLAENAEKPKTGPSGVRSEAVRTAARFSELSKAEKAALWAETQRYARQAR